MEFSYEVTGHIDKELIAELEEVLVSHIGTDNFQEVSPCHSGSVLVNLNVDSPFLNQLAGNAKCSCGRPLVSITGTSDMKLLNIHIVEKA